jgi:hypothetical protein
MVEDKENNYDCQIYIYIYIYIYIGIIYGIIYHENRRNKEYLKNKKDEK